MNNMENILKEYIDKIKSHSKKYHWVGIYLYKDGVLELFPYYIGRPTPHTKIPIDKGICGTAFRENKTLIVNDVSKDERYLACSIWTKSEIVVPIRDENGNVLGEIDIDSDYLNAFDEGDKEFLESIAKEIGKILSNSS